MSVTVLERLELTVEDFAPPCEAGDCDDVAIYVMHTFCCPRLVCEHCATEFMVLVSQYVGGSGYCSRHPENEIVINKISDFILSIDPI